MYNTILFVWYYNIYRFQSLLTMPTFLYSMWVKMYLSAGRPVISTIWMFPTCLPDTSGIPIVFLGYTVLVLILWQIDMATRIILDRHMPHLWNTALSRFHPRTIPRIPKKYWKKAKSFVPFQVDGIEMLWATIIGQYYYFLYFIFSFST